MNNLYSTKITIEVLSDTPLDGLTLEEIDDQIEGNYFLTGSLSSESTRLAPMEMSEILVRNDIERAGLMGDEALEDQPHISIEYDPLYSGGDYADVGDRVYIPQAVFDRFEKDEKKAFAWWTGLDPVHIICVPDDLYTAKGEEWESN